MINISYEDILENLHTINLTSIENLSFIQIIELIHPNLNTSAKCWIYIDKSDVWIECHDSFVLSLLIKGIGGEEIIYVIFRENKVSPNSTVMSNISIHTGSIINDVEFNIINEIEPFTYDEINTINKEDLVLIPTNITKNYYAVYIYSLINFFKSQLANGKRFFEIEFSFEEETIIFTKELWTKYLLRGNHNNKILVNFFADIFYNFSNSNSSLDLLKNYDNLYLRLKFFINDLLIYKNERLQFLSSRYPEYYFSLFYFTEDEIDMLINFPTSSGLLYRELFDQFIKDKIELCTSHDIAPFMYKIFGITKNFNKDPSFIKNYKKFKGL